MNTEEIQGKYISALFPFNRRFFELYKKNPDLYGPFWIMSTLIVVLVIAANLENYWIAADKEKF